MEQLHKNLFFVKIPQNINHSLVYLELQPLIYKFGIFSCYHYGASTEEFSFCRSFKKILTIIHSLVYLELQHHYN